MRNSRTIVAWAGFCGGKLLSYWIDDGFGGYGKKTRISPAIFRTRKEARSQFEDVRRVRITEERT